MTYQHEHQLQKHQLPDYQIPQIQYACDKILSKRGPQVGNSRSEQNITRRWLSAVFSPPRKTPRPYLRNASRVQVLQPLPSRAP